MSKVEILSHNQHRDIKLNIDLSAEFDDVSPIVNVVADELSSLVLDSPVFITKNSHTSEFELCALLGFSQNENLFVSDGHWRGSYIPMDIRRQPFQACLVGPNASASVSDISADDELKIGLNVESNRLSRDHGIELFNDDGSLTDYVTSVLDILKALLQGTRSTNVFLKRLAELDLIVPAKLDIQLEGQDKVSFDGLYSIQAERLASMQDSAVLEFHKKDYFQACHAILHSHGHLHKLIEWKSKQR